jgi:hypothetical protein
MHLRAYLAHLHSSRADIFMPLVFAGIIALLLPDLIVGGLGWFGVSLAGALAAASYGQRVLIIGVPVATLLLAALFALDYRTWCRGSARASAAGQLPWTPAPRTTLGDAALETLHGALTALPRRLDASVPVEFLGEGLTHLHEWPERFDPARYFDHFRHVHLRKGLHLDFVYYFWGNGGYPVLYPRPHLAMRRSLAGTLDARNPPDWLSAVDCAPNAQGALELVLLAFEGPRFYLYWHSMNEREMLYTQSRFDAYATRFLSQVANNRRITGGLTHDVSALDGLDWRPSVELFADHASVRMLEYVPREGIVWVDYRVERPARVREVARTVVAHDVLPPVTR